MQPTDKTSDVEQDNFFTGYPVMRLDRAKLDAYIDACIAQGVVYGLGDKDPKLGSFPPDFRQIDCSGFMRALIYYATSNQVEMPDGSYNQLAWLHAQNFKISDYASTGAQDNVARICVYEAKGRTGHIWLVLNGSTYESHGSSGPSHRNWNCDTLKAISGETTVFAVAQL